MTTTLPVVHDPDLETVCLVWLDASANVSTENITTQKQLRSIIHHLKTFENVQDCEQYIRQKSKDDRIFFVVSGRLGLEIVPRVHQYRQIFSIYVYCQDKQRNEEWASKFTKIKGVIVQSDLLINQIQSDYLKRIQSKVDEPFPIKVFKSTDSSLNDEFIRSQLLLDCLPHMKSIATDKLELINLCKTKYQDNNTELSIIQEFQQKYICNQSIWWYTRESFLSRLLNKALCMKNLDLLFLYGFFIRDIHENLQKNKCKSFIQVYHGQLMSTDELNTFKNSTGEYISINRFFVANYNRKQTISNLNENPLSNDLVRILFEIDADPQIDSSKPFANITQFAYFSEDQQILFMLGSVFQLTDIQHDKKTGLWIIKIVFAKIKKEYDPAHLISCGQLLQEMKKLDDAEKYFSRLIKEMPSNHKDISQCYHSLGFLSFLNNNYDVSLQWYQKLLNIFKSNDPNLATSYYSIGCVHQKMGDYNQALECYNKALSIWKEVYGDDEPLQMAGCFNNMGCIYEIEKDYSKALEYHKQALSIRDKYQIDIGSSYNNIGNIYLSLENYDVALENYIYSFEVKRQSLSMQDPSLATTLTNIGLVYEQDGNLDEALRFYKKAAAMFEQIYSSVHIYNIEIQQDIQRVSFLEESDCLNTSFD